MVQKTRVQHTKQLAVNKAIDFVYSGKYNSALVVLKKHFKPNSSTQLFFKGWIAQLSNNHEKAVYFLEKAVVANPLNQDALTGLVTSYLELEQADKAYECAEQLVLINKEDPRTLLTLAIVKSKKHRGQPEEQSKAIELYKKAFELIDTFDITNPHTKELILDILSGWGASLIDIGAPEESIKLLETARNIDNFNPLVHKNLASAYTSIGRIDEAIDSAINAQRSDDPEIRADAMYQQGMLELLKGNYSKGWRLHEFRLHTKRFSSILASGVRYWQGEPLSSDEKLLVFQEQGIGDTLQFSRYLPIISSIAPNIDIQVMPNQYQKWYDPKKEPGSIKAFLANNYKNYIKNCYIKGWDNIPLEDYSYIVSFMSLPKIFKTTLNTIPDIPKFKSFSSAVFPQKDIGILWQGSKEHKNDKNRSVPLDIVQNFTKRHNKLSFTSLQLESYKEMEHISQVGHRLHSLDDALSLLYSCKLIITVDSMIAHLAGSAGIKTWVLHAYSPDWRWLLDVDKSPWYPSIINYRQSSPKDWHTVFEQLSKDIEAAF
jgi:tetratricopeptide (TPR) repeat protein